MRRVLAFPVLVLSACGLPERDNVLDPAIAPRVQMGVRVDGTRALEGKRHQQLEIDLSGTLDPQTNVLRPQDFPVAVTIDWFEPRSAEDIASSRCPSIGEDHIASVTVTAGVGTFAWTHFPPPCFDVDPLNPARTLPQRVGLRAVGRDVNGNVGSAETTFGLRNSPPVADPGPMLWVDPSWSQWARLSATRSKDPDGDVPARSIWHLRHPTDSYVGSNLGISFKRDLSYLPAGASAVYELAVCDAWECGDPATLDVALQAPLWAVSADALVQLDTRWTHARSLRLTSGAPVQVPTPIGVNEPLLAPGGFGMFVIPRGVGPTVRHVQPSFVVDASFALTGIAIRVVGQAHDVRSSFVTVSGTPSLYEVGPEFSAAPIPVPGSWADVVAARGAGGGPTLIFANEAPGQWYFAQWDGITLDVQQYLPPPSCILEQDDNIDYADVGLDGTMWVALSTGAVLHLSADGDVLSCQRRGGGTTDPISFTEIIALPDGTAVAAAAWDSPDISAEVVPGLWLADDESLELVLPLAYRPGGLGWDPVHRELFVRTFGSIEVVEPGAWVSRRTTSLVGIVGNTAGDTPFALDASGLPWLIANGTLIRIPPTFELEYARLGGDVIEGAFPLTDDQLSLDRGSGKLWVAHRETTGATSFIARAYDERGRATHLLPAEVPLPGNVQSFLFDSGTPLLDQGDTGWRAPAFWVNATDGEPWIVRAELDGTISAAFGPPAPIGGFPMKGTYSFNPIPFGLGTMAAGEIWAPIHDENLTDLRLGEVYRLQPDGQFLRGSAQSTLTGLAPSRDGRPCVDAVGNFFVGAQDTVVRTAPSMAMTVSTGLCASPTGFVASTWFDTAGDVIALCAEPAGGGNSRVPQIARLRASLVPITYVAVANPPVFGTNAAGFPALERAGWIDPITGSWWIADGAVVRVFDRFGGERTPHQVLSPIVHLTRR